MENADHAPGHSVEAKGWWTWLLGVRPERGERIYLGSALFQIWALLYLVVGFLAALVGDVKTVVIVASVFAIAGFPFVGLVMHLLIRFRSRRQ